LQIFTPRAISAFIKIFRSRFHTQRARAGNTLEIRAAIVKVAVVVVVVRRVVVAIAGNVINVVRAVVVVVPVVAVMVVVARNGLYNF